MVERLSRPAGSGLTSERARARMLDALRGLGVRDEVVLAAMHAVRVLTEAMAAYLAARTVRV